MQKKTKLCPYRTKSIVYKNRVSNPNIPDYGISKIYDYDVVDIKFYKCLEKECMMYDPARDKCKYRSK